MLGPILALTLASQPAVIQDEYAIGASLWLESVRTVPSACLAEIRAVQTDDAQRRPHALAGIIAGTIFKIVQSAEATEMVYDQHVQDTLNRYFAGEISYGEVRRVQEQVAQLRDEPTIRLRAYEIRFPSCRFTDHLRSYRAVRRAFEAR